MRDDIKRRIKKHGEHSGICYICGRTFKSNACPHSVSDQEIALAIYRAEQLLG